MKSNLIIIGLSIVIGILVFTNIKQCRKEPTIVERTVSHTTVVNQPPETLYVTKTKYKILRDTLIQVDSTGAYTYISDNIDSSYAVYDTITVKNSEILNHSQGVEVKEKTVYTETTIYIRDSFFIKDAIKVQQVPLRFLYGATYTYDDKQDVGVDLGMQTNIGHLRVSKSILDVNKFEVSILLPFKSNKRSKN